MSKHRLNKRDKGPEPYWVLFQTVWWNYALFAGHEADGWVFETKHHWLNWREKQGMKRTIGNHRDN